MNCMMVINAHLRISPHTCLRRGARRDVFGYAISKKSTCSQGWL